MQYYIGKKRVGHLKQTQLLKGVLEGCVLLMIGEEEVYGYEMVQLLRKHGFKDIVAGTVYPLLQKLEKRGCLSSTLKYSPDGPDRKYYRMTPEGRAYCRDFIHQWARLSANVNDLIRLKGEDLHE